MCIAAIADVHGNPLALEAVLADVRAASPDLLVNLGDLVCGQFDPRGSADAQMALGYPTLRGNHNRWVVDDPSRRSLHKAHPTPAPPPQSGQTSRNSALSAFSVGAGNRNFLLVASIRHARNRAQT